MIQETSSPAPALGTSLDAEGLALEQRGLLDFIDKLQFCQLDNVKLPQIVVVGDQSAGKSSVLEALTGTPFPRDAGACTRFATEIRLRRSKESKLNVSIIPDKTRPYDEQTRLTSFGGDAIGGDASFETLMRDAVEQIAPKHIPGRFAARDVLVVEKSGPDMPLLTLVDLPGLVRVANRDQSEADIQTIEALSDHYMRSHRTIILSVIGGNNDYVQAPILKKARQFDPSGSRTIGVLTKPDLTEQIGLEDKFIELVSNKDEENNFKLGWYVLLNPGPPRPGEPWPSADQRRQREEAFFGRGKWSALPPNMCGIGALRQKLSLQLQRHIGKHVKSLRRQIQKSLDRCETELKAMGTARDTVEEMRQEMSELFSASNSLVTPAVDGTYKNPPGVRFFAKQSDPRGTPSQKLRARVNEESERFAAGFRQNGRKTNFAASASNLPSAGSANNQAKKDFAKREVEPLLAQIRGNELPMDSNPRAPYILFQDYSASWPDLAHEYKDNLVVICNEFLADIIDYTWPVRMRDPLRVSFLEPNMKTLLGEAEKELGELTTDTEFELQPFDPEYETRLRRWRAEASEQADGQYTEAEEVLEKMLIYYDLTARVFIRNVVTQVVERHLMRGMLRLFNPSEILGMENKKVELIASENVETRDRRMTLKAQKVAIEEAKSMCASLAMRSELRAYDDDGGDEDTPTDDDDDNDAPGSAAPTHAQRPAHASRPVVSHQPQQQQQQQQQQQRIEQQQQRAVEQPAVAPRPRTDVRAQPGRRTPSYDEAPPMPPMPSLPPAPPAQPQQPPLPLPQHLSSSPPNSGGFLTNAKYGHATPPPSQPQQPPQQPPPQPPPQQEAYVPQQEAYGQQQQGQQMTPEQRMHMEAYYAQAQAQGQMDHTKANGARRHRARNWPGE